MNGDRVRDVRFLGNWHCSGYVRSQVDDLLRQVAAELDGGRPVGSLISSATLRTRERFPERKNCDADAVDWFLAHLRSNSRSRDELGFSTDPWHDLADVTQYSRGGAGLSYRAFRKNFAQQCVSEWRDFGHLPGVRLRWLRTGRDHELRDESDLSLVTLRPGGWLRGSAGAAVTTGERTFTFRSARVKRKGKTRSVTELVDTAGLVAFYHSGENFDRRAQARITFPDRQVLRFPVRGIKPEHASMTAVDQTGIRVARYRKPVSRLSQQTEITVNPQWDLTAERLVALAISAPWLSRYFASPH